MFAKYLWEIGSIVIIIIGLLHFRGTFFAKLLHPKNKELTEIMKKSPLHLTDQLPIWNPWIGFNAAFSNGALFLGIKKTNYEKTQPIFTCPT